MPETNSSPPRLFKSGSTVSPSPAESERANLLPKGSAKGKTPLPKFDPKPKFNPEVQSPSVAKKIPPGSALVDGQSNATVAVSVKQSSGKPIGQSSGQSSSILKPEEVSETKRVIDLYNSGLSEVSIEETVLPQ